MLVIQLIISGFMSSIDFAQQNAPSASDFTYQAASEQERHPTQANETRSCTTSTEQARLNSPH